MSSVVPQAPPSGHLGGSKSLSATNTFRENHKFVNLIIQDVSAVKTYRNCTNPYTIDHFRCWWVQNSIRIDLLVNFVIPNQQNLAPNLSWISGSPRNAKIENVQVDGRDIAHDCQVGCSARGSVFRITVTPKKLNAAAKAMWSVHKKSLRDHPCPAGVI